MPLFIEVVCIPGIFLKDRGVIATANRKAAGAFFDTLSPTHLVASLPVAGIAAAGSWMGVFLAGCLVKLATWLFGDDWAFLPTLSLLLRLLLQIATLTFVVLVIELTVELRKSSSILNTVRHSLIVGNGLHKLFFSQIWVAGGILEEV